MINIDPKGVKTHQLQYQIVMNQRGSNLVYTLMYIIKRIRKTRPKFFVNNKFDNIQCITWKSSI